MRLRARPSPLRCGWCLSHIEGAARRCPGCGAFVHALCSTEAGICPAYGCGRGVRHGQAVRVRKLEDVREEMRLVFWSLVLVVVWTAAIEAVLAIARLEGWELRLESIVLIGPRDRVQFVPEPGAETSSPPDAPPSRPPPTSWGEEARRGEHTQVPGTTSRP